MSEDSRYHLVFDEALAEALRALWPEQEVLTLTDDPAHGPVTRDLGDEWTALRLMDSASWNGLVLIQFRDEAEIEGGSLIRLTGSSRIIGGLALHFRGDEIEIEDNGKILTTEDTSSILYSSELLNGAPGTSAVVSGGSVNLLSYRIY